MPIIYKETKEMIAVTRAVRAICDECHAQIPIVANFAPEDALEVRLVNDYAGYFCRPAVEPRFVAALLCKTCADRLLAAFPSLARAIEKVPKAVANDDKLE